MFCLYDLSIVKSMICHGMTDKQTDWLTDGHKHIDWRTDDKTTNEEDDEIVVADVVVVAAVVVANVVVVVVVVEIVVVEIFTVHAHCRNGTGATGQAFCVLARGRLMWYVYHVTLVGVARSWAAMSLLARSGYVVLHALGLAFFTVAHVTNSLQLVFSLTVRLYAP